MKRRDKNRIRALLLAACMGMLAGCAEKDTEAVEQPEEMQAEAAVEEEELQQGGTLVLKVNPEIAVEYDQDGKVTAVRGRNEDGRKIIKDDQEYVGRECHEVVEDLVRTIHEAGYFVEEVEGAGKKITIEIETGSIVPEEDFLDEIVTGVQTYVKDMQVGSPIEAGLQDSGKVKKVDIYDSDYSERSYEVVVPSSDGQTGAGADTADPSAQPSTGQAASDSRTSSPTGQAASDSQTQPSAAPDTSGTTQQPPASHDSPYTDYDTPYTDYDTPYTEPKAESPYTDYDTPYEESPYTDYDTPYTEPESPYTDYEDSHYEDSSYSHYEEDSGYSDYD